MGVNHIIWIGRSKRCRQMWEDMGRCWQMWGDVGRRGKTQTIALVVAALGTNMLPSIFSGGLSWGSLSASSSSEDVIADFPAIILQAIDLPAPVDSLKSGSSVDTAILAGGCFWGIEAVFEHVRGVRNVVSGYSGGDSADAQYKLVSRGRTQHAESVRIVYDPSVVSYGTLLQIFFSVAHDLPKVAGLEKKFPKLYTPEVAD